MHAEKEIKTAGDAIEAIKEIAHLQEGLLSVVEVNIIDKACDVLETLEINNDKLRETIDEKNKEIESLEEDIEGLKEDLSNTESNMGSEMTDLENEVRDLNEKIVTSGLPSETLDDINKNKILAELHYNLSIFQLDELLVKAKEIGGKPWKETI